MSKLILGKGELYVDGKKVGKVEQLVAEILKPVKVTHHTRWGMGYDYDEKIYSCPNCTKMLAYHNGVKLISGSKSQKYCSNCGYKLYWRDTE